MGQAYIGDGEQSRCVLCPAQRDPFAREKEPRGRGALFSATFPPCPASPLPGMPGWWVLGGPRAAELREPGCLGRSAGVQLLTHWPSWARASPRLGRETRWCVGLGAAVRAGGPWRARGGGGPHWGLAHLGGWSAVGAGGRSAAGCRSLGGREKGREAWGGEPWAVLRNRGELKNHCQHPRGQRPLVDTDRRGVLLPGAAQRRQACPGLGRLPQLAALPLCQLPEGGGAAEGEDQGAAGGEPADAAAAAAARARAPRDARGGAALRGQGPGSRALPCPEGGDSGGTGLQLTRSHLPRAAPTAPLPPCARVLGTPGMDGLCPVHGGPRGRRDDRPA